MDIIRASATARVKKHSGAGAYREKGSRLVARERERRGFCASADVFMRRAVTVAAASKEMPMLYREQK